jgi:hypothetical protein
MVLEGIQSWNSREAKSVEVGHESGQSGYHSVGRISPLGAERSSALLSPHRNGSFKNDMLVLVFHVDAADERCANEGPLSQGQAR